MGWIDKNALAMQVQDVNEFVVIRYFPLLLGEPATNWLNILPAGSLNLWEYLRSAFISNFSTTCK
jgi:hypothetical protein